MTIAVGLLARGGIVVAADSQVTQGDGKLAWGKMQAAFVTDPDTPDGTGSCVIAAAGTVPHGVECAREIRDVFSSDRHRKGPELRDAFADSIQSFHDDHIVPFSAIQDPPFAELIIASQRDHRSALYYTHRTVVADGEPYCAVGFGSTQALTHLRRLYQLPYLSVPETIMLAAYVVFQVKESDLYCGGRTDIYYVRRNGFWMVNPALSRELDDVMREYGPLVEARAFRAALGSEQARPGSQVGALKRRLKKLLARLSEQMD